MTWSENIAALAAASVTPEVFGEPVVLPSGVETSGLFVEDPAQQALWGQPEQPGIGAWGRSTKATPELYLHPSDTAGLQEQDRLQVHGERWLIAKIDPEREGLHRIELMRDAERFEDTQGAVWR